MARLREEMYDTARGLHDLGLVDAQTLREFDASRLPALKPYGAADIKRLRLKAKTSQSEHEHKGTNIKGTVHGGGNKQDLIPCFLRNGG
jgi:DNA-binding transcriptional regulator YiaG